MRSQLARLLLLARRLPAWFGVLLCLVAMSSPVFGQGQMPAAAPDFRQAAPDRQAALDLRQAPDRHAPDLRQAVAAPGTGTTAPANTAATTAPNSAPSFNDTTGSAGVTRVSVPSPASGQPLTGQVSSSGAAGAAAAGRAALTGQVGVIQTPPALSGATSQNVPPEMFQAWLQKAHPDFALSAARNSEQSVVEVKGQWDDAGKTLRMLGIPYHRIRAGDLRDLPLDNVKVLVVNCPGDVPRESLQRIRDFVARGGFLLATDWALDNLVQKAFPGYVEPDGKQNHRAIYDAELVNPEGPLFANTVTNAHWKMDKESHMLRVLKPGTVRVLAHSTYLSKEDPASGGALAVVFPFGRGQVMHMLAHFDNNALFHFGNSMPDPAPVIGISLRQALASNFIVMGLTHERARP